MRLLLVDDSELIRQKLKELQTAIIFIQENSNETSFTEDYEKLLLLQEREQVELISKQEDIRISFQKNKIIIRQ